MAMRILIVEDDAPLAAGIAQILHADGYAVEVKVTGAEALEAAERERSDLVLLDIGLPGMDGYEVLRRLRSAQDRVSVLVLTARDAVRERVHGLDLGADDYLAKPFAMAELSARVRALIRRAQAHSSPRVTHGPLTFDKVARRAYLSGQPLELTAREWAVLQVLLAKVEKMVSKDSIIHAVGGWDDNLSSNAIEVYVSRLRAKLEPAGIRIRTVRGFGYQTLTRAAGPLVFGGRIHEAIPPQDSEKRRSCRGYCSRALGRARPGQGEQAGDAIPGSAERRPDLRHLPAVDPGS
jgi:two-component system OmpR family response regulator